VQGEGIYTYFNFVQSPVQLQTMCFMLFHLKLWQWLLMNLFS